jgi:hypothetical protein
MAIILALAVVGMAADRPKTVDDFIKSATGATITYRELSSADSESRWKIPFTKEDITSAAQLLKDAKIADPGLILSTVSYKGTLGTDDGEYEITIAREKAAVERYVINLISMKDGRRDYRNCRRFILPENEGHRFFELLTERLREHARSVKPDSVKPLRTSDSNVGHVYLTAATG